MAGVLLALAGIAAVVLNRRDRDAPTQARWTIPAQLDRADFARPDAPWLVVAFTSATCDTCADVTVKVEALSSSEVAAAVVEAGVDREIHDRYGIDAVPTILVANAAGVVQASFVGPVTATDLWATVAEAREPGSVPEGCDHGQPPG